MLREIKRFNRGKKMDTMENRVTTAQDNANLTATNPVPTIKEVADRYTYEQLQECYQHLSAMTERQNIPYGVMSALHNHAAKILRGLKKKETTPV